jgi:hypothetical protein
MRKYSVRKMGTRNGAPHYGATCNLCSYARNVIVVAHMSKDGATDAAIAHVARMHGAA